MLGRIFQNLHRQCGRRALKYSHATYRGNSNEATDKFVQLTSYSIPHHFYAYSTVVPNSMRVSLPRICAHCVSGHNFKSQFVRTFSHAAVADVETDTGANTGSDGRNKPKKGERKLRMLKDPIVLTDAAIARIKVLLSKRPDAEGVRLGVRTRGCNGLSYTLNYAEKDGGKKFETRVDSKGVSVFIEPKALMYLLGTTMDFYEDDLTAEFRFENPNADSYCGCGESFNVKKP